LNVNSESSSFFFYNPCVLERQLCIVNQSYAFVAEQQ
jgi:hypothetical protein